MQARTLPTARGWAWIVDGFALWRRNPALITFLVFGMSLSLLLVAAVPFIGRVAMSLVAPALSLGVFNGCKAVAERRKVGPDILFSGFRQNLPEQIKIGGLYLIGTVITMGLTTLIDPDVYDTLSRLILSEEPSAETLDADADFFVALAFGALTQTPLMMAYWFAPILAGWGKVPAVKAMFFSVVACWRNWRPFLAYSIGLMGVAVAAMTLISVIGLLSPLLAVVPAMAFPIVFVPVVFASTYTNAVDVLERIGPDDIA
ncbi:MAG TPA: BPSS1780 family membrane protein [Burkholderiaceae bacterium]|nr:BPSS1780 family membrane protein [Burkholderiaceae bacterium]